MTESKPTPEQKLPAPDPEETSPNPADETSTRPTGFFNRVRQELNEPVHPSEAAEIVVDPDTLE